MELANKWNFIGYNMFNCPSCGTPYTMDEFRAIQRYGTEPYFPDYCPNCGENMSEEDTRMDWVPCSERLPEEDENVLVTYKDGRMALAYYNGSYWTHSHYHSGAPLKTVVAWMPMPKAYKEGG